MPTKSRPFGLGSRKLVTNNLFLWPHGLLLYSFQICSRIFVNRRQIDIVIENEPYHSVIQLALYLESGLVINRIWNQNVSKKRITTVEEFVRVCGDLFNKRVPSKPNLQLKDDKIESIALPDHEEEEEEEKEDSREEIDYQTSAFEPHESDIEAKGPSKTYPCRQEGCDKVFTNSRGRKNHMSHRHYFGSFSCSSCEDFNCKTAVDLFEHFTAQHKDEPFSCPVCKMLKFESDEIQSFLTHYSECWRLKRRTIGQRTKTDDRKYPCGECGKIFPKERLLKEHLNWHKVLLPPIQL